MDFGKHFAGMYEGSLVGKGSVVFAVMGYVIANQRPELVEGGERLVVGLNPTLLGLILGDGEEAVSKAIEFLCKEDPKSRSKEQKGKRLVRLGQYEYWVVNGRYYRELGREERRREQNRVAAQRHREKEKSIEQAMADAREERRPRELGEPPAF